MIPTLFNELEEKILELYISGKSKNEIATILQIPENEVKKVFYKPKVKEKLQELIEFKEVLLKEKHLNILEDITEEMMEKVRESGDFSDVLAKNRDILDVISLTNQVLKEQEKKRLGTNDENTIASLLIKLSKDDDGSGD